MNKWIPTSERMPELHQDVLVTIKNDRVDFGYLCFAGEDFRVGNSVEYVDAGEVIAWMPLPEPYAHK